jgi:hypothetical protein
MGLRAKGGGGLTPSLQALTGGESKMRATILGVTCVALALLASIVAAQTEPLAATRLAPDEFV